MLDQINRERITFGEQRATLEREIDRLCTEKKELEAERQDVAIEKASEQATKSASSIEHLSCNLSSQIHAGKAM